MNPTGIVRRIDDLGRVVISKSIRNKYGISEGDALEFFETEDGILIKRYDPELEYDII